MTIYAKIVDGVVEVRHERYNAGPPSDGAQWIVDEKPAYDVATQMLAEVVPISKDAKTVPYQIVPRPVELE